MQEALSAKPTDQKARHNHFRVYGVPEGSEDGTTTTFWYLLKQDLDFYASTKLQIEKNIEGVPRDLWMQLNLVLL